jgi:hypothetical protein
VRARHLDPGRRVGVSRVKSWGSSAPCTNMRGDTLGVHSRRIDARLSEVERDQKQTEGPGDFAPLGKKAFMSAQLRTSPLSSSRATESPCTLPARPDSPNDW